MATLTADNKKLIEVVRAERAFYAFLTKDQQTWLENHPLKLVDWCRRERYLCEQDVQEADWNKGFLYWLDRYGWIRPKAGGDLVPLEMYQWQRGPMLSGEIGAAEALILFQFLAVLKTRQPGMTSIDRHHTAHLMGINKKTTGTDYFISSNTRENAAKYSSLTREILMKQPPWLRQAIGAEARDEVTGKLGEDAKFSWQMPLRRTTLTSVSATGASRSGAVRKYVGDEAAHPPHTMSDPFEWTGAADPTARAGGQVVLISTGNGDAHTNRPGRAFAHIWRSGQKGQGGVKSIFISWKEDPTMSEKDRENYAIRNGWQKAMQEYPDTPDEALAGNQEGLAFNSEHVAACVELGRYYKELREQCQLPPPVNGRFWSGTDFGKHFRGHFVYPLAGWGRYIPPGVKANEIAGEDYAVKLLTKAADYEVNPMLPWEGSFVRHEIAYYDSGGMGGTLAESIANAGPDYLNIHGISFNKWKRPTLTYWRTLMQRTFEGRKVGWCAIDPDNTELIQQLYSLEVDENGDIIKGDDHDVDACLVGLALDSDDWREDYQAS